MSEHGSSRRGVFAAVATPLTDQFEPDHALFIDHCVWLLANGCDGLAPLGTTGEANSLSLAQRQHIIESLEQSDVPLQNVIVGAGSCALADAVALTRQAVRAGMGGFYSCRLSITKILQRRVCSNFILN